MLELPRQVVGVDGTGRAPYHDQEGRIALPVDPTMVSHAAPPPAIALVLAAATRRAPAEELAALVGADPALAAHIVRLATSTALGSGEAPRSLPAAVRDLGPSVVRDFTLIYMVASMTRELDHAAFKMPERAGLDLVGFCEQSLRRAVTALVAARRVGYEDPTEAFTAGLMQDFGLLIMAVLCPDRAAHLEQCRARPAAERLLWERALCGASHTEIIAPFAASWGIPGAIASAIAAHHDDVIAIEDRRAQRLAELLRLADAVTDLCQVEASETTLSRARMKLAALRAREPLTLQGLLDATAEHITELAPLLGFPSVRSITLADILDASTRTQARPGFGYEEKARRMEQLLREKEHLARELRGGRRLGRDVTIDPLTGVASRRELCAMLERLLSRTRDYAGPLSVVIIELDGVEDLDRDELAPMLTTAADRLKVALRVDDVIGRLGSDLPGFGVLLPGCDADAGERVASRLASLLRGGAPAALPDGHTRTIRASVGGATADAGCELSPDEVVSRCEEALERNRSEGGLLAWHRDEVAPSEPPAA